MKPSKKDYVQAAKLSDEIEAELIRLNRWSDPLLPEAYENMGAFGQSTMTFEQWIQFILLDRLRTLVAEEGDFPDGSSLAVYGVRAFDGDFEANNILNLLSQLDQLVEGINKPFDSEIKEQTFEQSASTISTGDKLPDVIYSLIDVLPQFEGDDLESQLQTFDMFLNICSPSVRSEVSALFLHASAKTENEISRVRIEAAAKSVANGGRAAEPYNHAEAVKKYQAEHRRNFPR